MTLFLSTFPSSLAFAFSSRRVGTQQGCYRQPLTDTSNNNVTRLLHRVVESSPFISRDGCLVSWKLLSDVSLSVCLAFDEFPRSRRQHNVERFSFSNSRTHETRDPPPAPPDTKQRTSFLLILLFGAAMPPRRENESLFLSPAKQFSTFPYIYRHTEQWMLFSTFTRNEITY